MLMAIPKVHRISQWDSATEIIYACPECGTSFGFYGDAEKFCHNCGEKIDWDGVPKYADKEVAMCYHRSGFSLQREIIKDLNTALQEAIEE